MQDKNNYRLDQGFAFALFFAIFSLLAWRVTAPLVIALLWAALLAFFVSPINTWLRRNLRVRKAECPSLAAGLTLLLTSLAVIVPILAMLFSLSREIPWMIERVTGLLEKIDRSASPADYIPGWTPTWIADQARAFFGDPDSARETLQKTAKAATTILTTFSKALFRGLASFFFELFISLMAAFFFIRDGEGIVEYVKSITPLDHEERELFFSRTKNLLNSVVFGIVLTVAVQAILGALGWWMARLPSPVFFGLLMFFFGMFPMGTAVVWLPGGIYLLATGDVRGGVLLLAWGTLIVSTIDNLLRPFIISGGGGEQISTLLVILGLFGGVIAWGFIGVFLGPVVMVLFTLVLDIYRSRRLKREGARL